MMKINVGSVGQAIGTSQSFHFNCPIAKISEDNETLWLDDNIEVQGEVVNNGRVLAVTGTIFGTAKGNCNRCLKEFVKPVEVSFAENYRQADDHVCMEGDDVFFQGDEIDITDLVRETLLLSEPLKMLCSEECKGLCPKCGADLNTHPCSCERDVIDPRLAALQQLLQKR
jgi:uncharacterized protein